MAALDYLIEKPSEDTTIIQLIDSSDFENWLSDQPKADRQWIEANKFSAKPGSFLALPGKKGRIDKVIAGINPDKLIWDVAGLPAKLPLGEYDIQNDLDPKSANDAALGWALGCYKFDWYKESTDEFSTLVLPKKCDRQQLSALAEGIELTRDLINIPASDMGPAELAQAAFDLADDFNATCRAIVDQDLLDQNFPSVFAVGKGAETARAPRLIDLQWGKEKDPKITLVGKGVCFDTGGLDIKPAAAMKLMKKDMGGAAHVLGLARAIMTADLPVRLRVIIPAVENAVSDKAMRPGDVVPSRKGLTIEIGHTDAEGRVILADALTLACEDDPELVIDFATLTGAARVALGTDLPALFCNNDELAENILKSSTKTQDPLWRMPLWEDYRPLIDGKTGDVNNESAAPFGGAITAALFLQEFTDKKTPWAHIDVMAWNAATKPGRPEGGEAMGLRAIFEMIKNRL